MGETLQKALFMVLGTLLFLCVAFGVAAIFYPPFAEGGTGIITVILGALTTTLGSILAGTYFNRPMQQAAKEEVKQMEQGPKEESNRR